jgi:hypothetical protein
VRFSYRTRKKPSTRGEKAKPYPFLCACAHERRACSGIGKGYNAFNRMERKSCDYLILPFHKRILSIERKVNILRGDVKSIQQSSHIAASTYSLTGRVFISFGKQISESEQLLQKVPVFTFGV